MSQAEGLADRSHVTKDWGWGRASSCPVTNGASRPLCSPRTGCALPAGASATAVTAGNAMAAVPQASSFTWPSSTVTTTWRSTWRAYKSSWWKTIRRRTGPLTVEHSNKTCHLCLRFLTVLFFYTEILCRAKCYIFFLKIVFIRFKRFLRKMGEESVYTQACLYVELLKASAGD